MYILDYSHIVLFLVARVKVCLIPVLCSVLYARTCSDFISCCADLFPFCALCICTRPDLHYFLFVFV